MYFTWLNILFCFAGLQNIQKVSNMVQNTFKSSLIQKEYIRLVPVTSTLSAIHAKRMHIRLVLVHIPFSVIQKEYIIFV